MVVLLGLVTLVDGDAHMLLGGNHRGLKGLAGFSKLPKQDKCSHESFFIKEQMTNCVLYICTLAKKLTVIKIISLNLTIL